MHISFLLDTEDPISPEADDIAMWCADIIREEGARATFCVVGENARLFRERGRRDVIAALAQHDIGLHSDQHSRHPTIIEYLADKGWEDGIEEAVRREKPGVDAIREVFGRMPSTFAGPGASWGPQIHAAMRRLGVPSVMYAHTAAPAGRGVHRFAGTRSYPRRDFYDLFDNLYRVPAEWRADLDRCVAKVRGFQAAGYEWAGVFLGHPTHILHQDFWDNPNLLEGRTLPREQWKMPTRIPEADLRVALANFRTTVRTLVAMPGITVSTIAQMNALYDARPARPVAEREARTMWERIRGDIEWMRSWPVLPRSQDLTRIEAATEAQLGTVAVEQLA